MKILCISLGCDKNLVDTEMMLGLLNKDGHTFTDDENEADIILINTCCFINDAKEESVNTILEMAEYKKSGKCRALIVTGCMGQRYKEEIIKEIPEVDGILGTSTYDEISNVLNKALSGEQAVCFHDLSALPEVSEKRIVTTGGHYAFLKISEGCNKRCTYCIIPSLRGPYRSVPMERLLTEAGQLAGQGVKELILVAQETTLYGTDLYGKKMLPELLRRLAEIPGIEWLRVQYCYPEEITEEVISAHLDTAGIPDPDLLIRTSGEQRLSNYLMWQLAYTEFYFTDLPWPDFSKEELSKAIEKYNQRERRYGGVKEEAGEES